MHYITHVMSVDIITLADVTTHLRAKNHRNTSLYDTIQHSTTTTYCLNERGNHTSHDIRQQSHLPWAPIFDLNHTWLVSPSFAIMTHTDTQRLTWWKRYQPMLLCLVTTPFSTTDNFKPCTLCRGKRQTFCRSLRRERWCDSNIQSNLT